MTSRFYYLKKTIFLRNNFHAAFDKGGGLSDVFVILGHGHGNVNAVDEVDWNRLRIFRTLPVVEKPEVVQDGIVSKS